MFAVVVVSSRNAPPWRLQSVKSYFLLQAQLALITKFVNAARYCCEIRNYSTCMQIIDALEMFVVKNLPVSYLLFSMILSPSNFKTNILICCALSIL